MLRKVLFPTNLSPLYNKILAWLTDTVLQRGSEVLLLHVVDPVLGADTPRMVREVEEELTRVADSLKPAGIRGIPIVLAGQEQDIIPRIARSRKCSLAIHVAPSPEEAQLMIQHLAIPQLIVAARPDTVLRDPLSDIAIAVDLSPDRTPRLLEKLQRFLNSPCPELSLVHVVPLEDTDSANGMVVTAGEALEEVAIQASSLALKTKTFLGSGTPESELPRIMNARNPSMVVAGLSHHGELWELLIGDTATHLLKRITCPLLLLPV